MNKSTEGLKKSEDLHNVCITFHLPDNIENISKEDISKLISYNKYSVKIYFLLKNLLSKVDDRNILELVHIGKDEGSDVEILNKEEQTNLKYVEGKPMRSIKKENIEKQKNTVYINFLTLLEYYKRDFIHRLEEHNEDSDFVDVVNRCKDNIVDFSNNNINNSTFIDLFSTIFTQRKAIYNYKYEITQLEKKLPELIGLDAEKLELTINKGNKSQIKLASIFSDVENEKFIVDKAFTGKYKIPVFYSKNDVKLLEKGEKCCYKKI